MSDKFDNLVHCQSLVMLATKFYFVYLFINILSIPLIESYNKSIHNDYVPRVVNGRPAQLGDVPYQVVSHYGYITKIIFYTFH